MRMTLQSKKTGFIQKLTRLQLLNPNEITKGSSLIRSGVNKVTETGLLYAPVLRYIAPDYFGWTKWITSVTNVSKVCQNKIEEHAANLNPDNPK